MGQLQLKPPGEFWKDVNSLSVASSACGIFAGLGCASSCTVGMVATSVPWQFADK